MSTPSVAPPRPDGRGQRRQGSGSWIPGGSGSQGARLPGARRRSVPHLLVGALLVLACATGFAVTAGRVDHRRAVLVLARPVTVGQALTGPDVREVRVASGAGVDVIAAGRAGSVLGRAMAVSLPAGALLTAAELGSAATPPAGQALLAELLKPGQFPPDLAPGTHVLLVPTPSSGGTAPTSARPSVAGAPWAATVVAVQLLDTGQGSVVTVQLPAAPARQLAALPVGSVGLVVVAAGGR